MKKNIIVLLSLLVLTVILTSGCTSSGSTSSTNYAAYNLEKIASSDEMLDFLVIDSQDQIDIYTGDLSEGQIYLYYDVIVDLKDGSTYNKSVSVFGKMPDNYSFQASMIWYKTSLNTFTDLYDYTALPYTFTYKNGKITTEGDYGLYTWVRYDEDGTVIQTIAFGAETPKPTVKPTADQNPTISNVGNEQAVKKAKSYLSFTSFSYQGLVEQLEYEGFTHAQAVYGANNCNADWFEQAVKKAKSYLSFTSFSYQGLVEQLEYEGFTHAQAVHGADKSYI